MRIFILALFCAVSAQENPTDNGILPLEYKKTVLEKPPFYESFQSEHWEKTWIPSQAVKKSEENKDEDLLRYRGEWKVEEPEVWLGISGDRSLIVNTPAAHHAISAKFKKPIDPAGKTLVIQYEVKFQRRHDCGGAYMKLLTADPDFKPSSFSDQTPYTIMFGPDKCGSNNKVHFIFRHKDIKTGVTEEKHMTSTPMAVVNKKTALYTLIIRPNNTFEMKINNESVKSGNLLEDFEPSVNPPKNIDDPTDLKPEDWVDEEMMEDPNALKPDDWDEDAPQQILDEKAEKPAGWNDDEPLMVLDVEAKKPEEWDDQEDGEWIAPMIPNPKCEIGCGEWIRPTIPNPKFKGKFLAPMIQNPAFKGIWQPKKIPNPDYYENPNPSNFNKIGAIGFELWTMSNGIAFDNIYIGHDEKDAQKLAEEQWNKKYQVELKFEEKDKPAPQPSLADEQEVSTYFKTMINFVTDEVLTFVDSFKLSPVDAITEKPEIFGGLVLAFLTTLYLITLPFRSSTPPSTKKEKVDVPEEDDDHSSHNDSGTDEKEEGKKLSAKNRKKASTKKVDE